jgi:hypothetical protein
LGEECNTPRKYPVVFTFSAQSPFLNKACRRGGPMA